MQTRKKRSSIPPRVYTSPSAPRFMEGRARAAGAGTVLNALATGIGCAFAIDQYTTATVTLNNGSSISGKIAGRPNADVSLIEQCVASTLERYGPAEITGGHVRTESDLPMASGLKSSSAAANATVLATLNALGLEDEVDRTTATKIGVEAARTTGVTVTGAFDDATASMLGGVTITDNEVDRLISREPFERTVAIHIPDERAYSADADIGACQRIAPVAETIADLATEGQYGRAMTINGFAFSAALEFPTSRMLEALPNVDGVSLSGTGPSTVAIGTDEQIQSVAATWSSTPGTVLQTQTTHSGAEIL